MAFNNLTKSLKFLFFKKLSSLLMPHTQRPKPFKPIFKTHVNIFPYRNLVHDHQRIPVIHRNILMNNVSVHKSLVNKNLPQTKFSTESKQDCEDEEPPLGRHDFHKETEESINEQIGAELNAAFAYLSMACYFGRTDVALPGCQGFFTCMYEEELEHAMVFVNYLLLRGAQVNLSPIEVPESQDWESIKNAFDAALEMEKFVKEKLVSVFYIAEKHRDLEVMDIVSTQFMEEQNRSICELARLLKKAEMTDDPVGEYLFDKMVYNSFVKKSKNNLMYKKKLDDESEKQVYK